MKSEEPVETGTRLPLHARMEGLMGLPTNRRHSRLPQRFPVGATYVVTGYGGGEGDFRTIARYVVLPSGERINVPVDIYRPAAARTLALRRKANSKQSRSKGRFARGREKNAVGRGTV
jgi:hypothetical protein